MKTLVTDYRSLKENTEILTFHKFCDLCDLTLTMVDKDDFDSFEELLNQGGDIKNYLVRIYIYSNLCKKSLKFLDYRCQERNSLRIYFNTHLSHTITSQNNLVIINYFILIMLPNLFLYF